MSDAEAPVAPANAGSLEQRAGQRRRERERQHASLLLVPVNGFEDLLAARYRRLSWEEKLAIASRHEDVAKDGAQQVAASADMLINACEDLLEVVGAGEDGEPQYNSLGVRWNAQTIARVFELDEVPATARAALLAALDHEDLVNHFGAYAERVAALDALDDEEGPGESEPSVEG